MKNEVEDVCQSIIDSLHCLGFVTKSQIDSKTIVETVQQINPQRFNHVMSKLTYSINDNQSAADYLLGINCNIKLGDKLVGLDYTSCKPSV